MGSLVDPREPQVFPGLTAGGLHTLAVVEMGEVLSPRCGAWEGIISPNSRFHPPGKGAARECMHRSLSTGERTAGLRRLHRVTRSPGCRGAGVKTPSRTTDRWRAVISFPPLHPAPPIAAVAAPSATGPEGGGGAILRASPSRSSGSLFGHSPVSG